MPTMTVGLADGGVCRTAPQAIYMPGGIDEHDFTHTIQVDGDGHVICAPSKAESHATQSLILSLAVLAAYLFGRFHESRV